MRKTNIRRKSNIPDIIKKHVYNNIKEYLIVSILLLVGIVLGVIFINNISDTQKLEISNYINNFIETIKNNSDINKEVLLKKSILNNSIISFFMWFAGSTIIGIPIVLGIVAYRGFCISYTISSVIYSLGTGKGLIFAVLAILPHSIIYIPAILSLAVTGIRLYKTILKDRNVNNMKIELMRHTVFSLLIFILLVISSFVETYISATLLKTIIKYI